MDPKLFDFLFFLGHKYFITSTFFITIFFSLSFSFWMDNITHFYLCASKMVVAATKHCCIASWLFYIKAFFSWKLNQNIFINIIFFLSHFISYNLIIHSLSLSISHTGSLNIRFSLFLTLAFFFFSSKHSSKFSNIGPRLFKILHLRLKIMNFLKVLQIFKIAQIMLILLKCKKIPGTCHCLHHLMFHHPCHL